MKVYVLLSAVSDLFTETNMEHDQLDTAITLDKMSDEQREDMAAMIEYFRNNDETASYILAQVCHDLAGLKAGFLGLPEGIGFSPRSAGYAVRTAQ
jgi:hypothetical protein